MKVRRESLLPLSLHLLPKYSKNIILFGRVLHIFCTSVDSILNVSIQVRVKRINELYGGGDEVVYFEERDDKDIRLAQRLAFFASSDVLMITPTR